MHIPSKETNYFAQLVATIACSKTNEMSHLNETSRYTRWPLCTMTHCGPARNQLWTESLHSQSDPSRSPSIPTRSICFVAIAPNKLLLYQKWHMLLYQKQWHSLLLNQKHGFIRKSKEYSGGGAKQKVGAENKLRHPILALPLCRHQN